MDTASLATAPNGPANALARILALYRAATSSFLLRQLAAAYATSLEALSLLSQTNQLYGLDHAQDPHTRQPFFVLKQKLWVLNAAIFGAILADRVGTKDSISEHDGVYDNDHNNHRGGFSWRVRKHLANSRDAATKESPELLVRDLWSRLMDDYGGVEGNVDGKIMVSVALLCIHHRLFMLARQITEAYLASIPEDMLIHLEAAAGAQVDTNSTRTKDTVMINYERLTELYVVHILAKLRDWDSARDFVDVNSILSPSTKKVYTRTLEKLYRKSLRPMTAPKRPPDAVTRTADLDDHSPTSSSSANSTLVSSPTLSSLALPFPHKVLHSMDVPHSNVATATLLSGSQITAAPAKRSTKTSTDTALHRPSAIASRSRVATITSTVQGQLRVFAQRYTELLERISRYGIGTNQLMMLVALIVFLAAVSRSRVRATTATTTVIHRLLQSIKGTTAAAGT
ncbi:hypothetical protein EMPS_09946 [Entomortierella parvispora]|uniref:Uncharacterized protein n=1 Tax=Entomortierella parvispora TaxID=205924 RepID=A0A9P3M0V0_9FUNG|nr:hypothetical protein EMPS_09946 [Entomortierella parvispora]